jgi:aryl-phospho-beta-D-glucosidase BglC (GH1 family)
MLLSFPLSYANEEFPMTQQHFLTVQGDRIVNAQGQQVVLRGFGLGGWMNMENFITGYSANEEAQRQAICDALGEEKYNFFFDRFLTYFFGKADAAFVRSLGLNLVRIPINYRHFENDMRPFEIKEEGFKHLDRVIQDCAEQQIYTILDLHAVQGYQNQDWHSDNPTHKALFWKHKHFQDRAVHLWEVFAERYKGNPWMAGYNLINEPYDPSEQVIEGVYQRMAAAVRAIDPDHILFLEGNRYSKDFHMFHGVIPNTVYTNHLYAAPGFINGGPYPGETNGEYFDKETLEDEFTRGSQFMIEHQVPVWVGEFGPVYTGDPANDAMRYHLLRDQLEIYDYYQANWAIWTYKDIGLQGVVYTAPDSPWMRLTQPFLEKKARLGADAWGGRDDQIRQVMAPVEELLAKEFSNFNPGPFGQLWYARRLVRHILISEALLPEFGELFRDLDENQIDALMQSFAFENCLQRQPLAELLQH